MDLRSHLPSFNHDGERLSGYSRQEFLGENIIKNLAPENVDLARQMLDRESRAGEPSTYEVEGISREGRRVAFEVSTRLIYQHGKPAGVQGIARDISDRKKAQATFRNLLKAAPDAIVVVNPKGRKVLVNAQLEKVFGYKRKGLLGEPVEGLIPKRFRGRRGGGLVGSRARRDAPRGMFSIRPKPKQGTELLLSIPNEV